MAVIVIFVEGADTKPDPLPIYFLDNDEHATLICEGLKESEYRSFNFTIKRCTRADRGRFAVWAKMVIDARDGVYGCIAAGIYNMIDEARAIISQRRATQEPVANPNENTKRDGNSNQISSKTENPTKTDEKLPQRLRKDSPSRVKAKAAFDYAMERISNAHAMTAVELFDAISEDGEAKEMLPPTAESFTKYLNDCGIRLRKSDTKPSGRSTVQRSDM